MRARRRQRGAVMVEVVIMLPMLLLIWAGVDYFRAAYARKLDSIGRAQAQAWKLAYSNDGSCFANKEPWAGFTGENDPANTSTVGDDGATITTTYTGSTSNSMLIYAHANQTVTQPTLAPRWMGGASQAVSGSIYITCNETVPKKDKDQDVLTPLWDFVKSIFKT